MFNQYDKLRERIENLERTTNGYEGYVCINPSLKDRIKVQKERIDELERYLNLVPVYYSSTWTYEEKS